MIGGAVIAALSFLLGGIDNATVQNVRWGIFAFGLICALCGVAVLAAGLCRPKRRLLPEGAEYRKKKAMMTAPELALYRTLLGVTDTRRYAVLPQTALAGVVDKISGGGFRSELFRIVDFCIADAADFEPLLLIELNDASHDREERKLRDDKVAAICLDAGIPLLTFSLAAASDERYVRSEVRRLLKK